MAEHFLNHLKLNVKSICTICLVIIAIIKIVEVFLLIEKQHVALFAAAVEKTSAQ